MPSPFMSNNWETEFDSIVRSLAQERATHVSVETFQTEVDIYKSVTSTEAVDSTLEVGAGAGLFSAFLILSGFTERAVCLDPLVDGEGPSNEAVEIQSDLNKFDSLRNNFVQLNGWFPDDLPEDSFEMIIFRKALHHIYPNPPEDRSSVVSGLRSAKSNIEPGGRIYILETTVPPKWFQLVMNLYRRTKSQSPLTWSHKRYPEQWTNCLKEAGYKNTWVETTPLNIAMGHQLTKQASLAISHRRLITGQKPS